MQCTSVCIPTSYRNSFLIHANKKHWMRTTTWCSIVSSYREYGRNIRHIESENEWGYGWVILTIEKWKHAVERRERGCIWACEMFERDSPRLYFIPVGIKKNFYSTFCFLKFGLGYVVLPVLKLAVHGTQRWRCVEWRVHRNGGQHTLEVILDFVWAIVRTRQ